MKNKLYVVVAMLLVLSCVVIVAFASGGPNSGDGSATVSNTAGTGSSYSFGYVFDSTYYGAIGTERPNTTTSGAGANVSFKSNVFTISATSSAGSNPIFSWNDKSAQNVSTEVTITNNSQSTLIIGYTFSVLGGTSEGSDYDTGSGTLTWLPGQTIFLTVKTQVTSWMAASSTATATFEITSCVEVLNYDLKIYPSQFGSYNYSVGSTITGALNPDSAVYTTQASASDKVTLSVPKINDAHAEDYYFYGWSVNGSVTASDKAYSGAVTTHTTVFPVFVKNGTVDESGNGPFYVNGKYYVFWREAFLAAGASYPVVLARDYTLPTTLQENGVAEPDGLRIGGDADNAEYIVPTGSIFLIPHDLTYSTEIITVADGVRSPIGNPFRTLTVPKNASLTVKGTFMANAVQGQYRIYHWLGDSLTDANGNKYNAAGAMYMGTIASDYGHVVLDGKIDVESGGKLYARGLITGDGKVNAKSGATVYQLIEVVDWRGGGSTLMIYGSVFPANVYYIQNIQVTTEYFFGSKMYGTYYTYAEAPISGDALVLGTSSDTALFVLKSGSVVMHYDKTGTRDGTKIYAKTTIDVCGEAEMLSLTLSFSYGVSLSMTTDGKQIPLPAGFDINICDGGKFTLAKELKVLPGARLTVEEGGEAILDGGKIYLYDVEDFDRSYSFRTYRRLPVSARLGADMQATLSPPYGDDDGRNLMDTKYNRLSHSDILIKETTDGELIVNGTLTIKNGGGVYSSSDSSAKSSQIKTSKNTGVIKIESATGGNRSIKEVVGAEKSTTTENFSFAIGTIFGASGTSSVTTFATSGTYYSTGTAWYTHRVVFDGYSGNTVYYTPGSDILPSSYTKPALSGTVEDDKYVYNKAWVQSGDMKAGTATASPYFLMKVGNGTKTQMKSALNLQYRLDDYIWMNAIVTIPAYADGTVKLDENYGDTLFLVSANDGKGTYYLVRKVIAKELTSEFKVTLSINGIKTVELDLSFQTFANSLPANHNHKSLVDKIWQYGEAAKAYFDYKALVDAGESTEGIAKPSEVLPLPGDVSNELNSKDKYFNTDTAFGYYLYTQGANILFEERLALIVNFKLVANGEKNAVDLKTLFGDDLVKVGLLVIESSDDFNKDPVLSFSTADVTSYVMYGKHDVTIDPSNPDFGGTEGNLTLGDRDLKNMSITFDLTGVDYLSRFQFRPYVIYKDANGNEQILYGRQFNYGLEDYIARQYKTSDAVGQQLLNNLLVTTWNYANAAAIAFPE